jgi:hypothetical protein
MPDGMADQGVTEDSILLLLEYAAIAPRTSANSSLKRFRRAAMSDAS